VRAVELRADASELAGAHAGLEPRVECCMSLQAIRAGAEDHLIKPLTDVRPVARALRNTCERHKRRSAAQTQGTGVTA
jgi:FixJ family two-component response regulator